MTYFFRTVLLILSCIVLQGASFASNTIEGIQVYQKNVHLSEIHKQKLANDIDRYYSADNLWAVLRNEFSLPHYEDTPEVQEQIHLFLKNHHAFLNEVTARTTPYLYFILQQVRKKHLPAELVLLPMIESDYNPFAYSSAGAAGIWQMMPDTASIYGIKQNGWYDGRRDVVASTRGALNYLAYLGNFFEGNWLLALAAYDTGEGNILTARQKNIREGKSTDFWSLPLSRETRDYVPRLLALATIIAHPERYPVHFPYIPNAPYLAQIDVGTQINLHQAASLAGITLTQLKQLNSGFNSTATDPHGPYKLILPIENVERFSENLAQQGNSPTLPAQNLNPPKKSTSQQLYYTSEKSHYTIQPGDTLYIVRKGDTLPIIAKRYHIAKNKLLTINSLTEPLVNEGDKLIIPTHASSLF